MYYYIYDAFLTHKKYDKLLNKIEGRLTDLGIKNKIIKFNLLKNFKDLIRDAIRSGAQNIVAVGNNTTLGQVVNQVVGFNITVGFIPIGDNNSFASYFGIPVGESACDTLSTRKTEMIDGGIINNQYFLSSIETVSPNTVIRCDDSFSISTQSPATKMGIYNFHPLIHFLSPNHQKIFDPQDGQLEAVSWPEDKQKIIDFKNLFKEKRLEQESLFKAKKYSIENKIQVKNILVDGWKILKSPLEIKVRKQALKMIVGRDRKF